MTRRSPWYFRVPIPDRNRDPAVLLEGFETYAQVRDRSAKLVADLWRGNQEERQKAYRLHLCQRNHRCGSAACPICTRRFRRWFVSRALSVLGL
jgi:hypothetical protein